jgi:hypothetical protein
MRPQVQCFQLLQGAEGQQAAEAEGGWTVSYKPLKALKMQ